MTYTVSDYAPATLKDDAIFRLSVDQQMVLGVTTRSALVKDRETRVKVKIEGGLNKNK